MSPTWRVAALTAACMVCFACGDDDGPSGGLPDGGTTGAIARFDPTDGPMDWDAIPFPHDLFLGPDGTVDLASLPSTAPVWEAVRAEVDRFDGFCTICPITFPIAGEIDRAGLPPLPAAGTVASANDPVVLVDVDPASPERGRFHAVELEWNDSQSVVTARPARGVVLRRRTKYAAAITSRLRAPDGTALSADPDFAAIRDGMASPDVYERARAIVEPALAELATAGVGRASIVGLAAFTTRDPTEDLLALKGVVDAAFAPSPPVAVVDRIYRAGDGTLDAVLGTPAENVPGYEVPAAAGTEGAFAMVHETTHIAIAGHFRAPRIVEGTGSEMGAVRRAADGTLAPGPMEDVPFLLIVPRDVDATQLPLVVFHHGAGGDRQGGFLLADTAGQAGIAVLAIEPFQHASRSTTARDEKTQFRDLMVPDGFAEHDGATVLQRVLGIAEDSGHPGGDPVLIQGVAMQMIGDLLSIFRLARDGDWSAVAATDTALAGLTFDRDRIFFVGLSLGTVMGTGALVVDDTVSAAVLNVPAADLVDTLLEGPIFRANITDALWLPAVRITTSFDERDRRASMHPAFGFHRWVTEPVMPISMARFLLRDRLVASPPPDVLWQIAHHDTATGTPGPEGLIASVGVPGVGAFETATIPSATAPFTANFDTGAGMVTAGVHQFSPASHFMAIYHAEMHDYEAPIAPPFRAVDPPVPFQNPVSAVHTQITHFFRTKSETGRAEIATPAIP